LVRAALPDPVKDSQRPNLINTDPIPTTTAATFNPTRQTTSTPVSPPQLNQTDLTEANCVLIQNHTNVTFGDIASTLGRKLSVRVGKISKSQYLPGFVVVPFPKPHYVTNALALKTLTIQSRTSQEIQLEIRPCRGRREYPYPSVAFLHHFKMKELALAKTLGINIDGLHDDYTECLLIVSTTSDDRNCIKVRTVLEDLLKDMHWVELPITVSNWSLCVDILRAKLSELQLLVPNIRMLAPDPEGGNTPVVYIFGCSKSDVEEAKQVVLLELSPREHTVVISPEQRTKLQQQWPLLESSLKSLNVGGTYEHGSVFLVAMNEHDLQKGKERLSLDMGNVNQMWSLSMPVSSFIQQELKKELEQTARDDSADFFVTDMQMIVSGLPFHVEQASRAITTKLQHILSFSYTFRADTFFKNYFLKNHKKLLDRVIDDSSVIKYQVGGVAPNTTSSDFSVSKIITLQRLVEHHQLSGGKDVESKSDKVIVVDEILFPNSELISQVRTLVNRVDHLRLSAKILTNRLVDSLQQLFKAQNLRTLDICSSFISETRVEALLAALLHNSELDTLSLGDTEFTDSGWQCLLSEISKNLAIVQIDLTNNVVGTAAGQALASLLSSRPTFQVLNLRQAKLSDESLKIVLDAIAKNPKLVEVNLSNMTLDTKAKAEFIAHSLVNHSENVFKTSIDNYQTEITILFFCNAKHQLKALRKKFRKKKLLIGDKIACYSIPWDISFYSDLTTTYRENFKIGAVYVAPISLQRDLLNILRGVDPEKLEKEHLTVLEIKEQHGHNLVLHTMGDWYNAVLNIYDILNKSIVQKTVCHKLLNNFL